MSLHFEKWFHGFWERIHQKVGSGWFRDGFLYLFRALRMPSM